MSKLLGLFSRADNAAPNALSEPPGALASDSRASAASDIESAILDCLGTVLQCWSHHPILLPDEQGAEAIRVIRLSSLYFGLWKLGIQFLAQLIDW